jgi:hypothetical protein
MLHEAPGQKLCFAVNPFVMAVLAGKDLQVPQRLCCVCHDPVAAHTIQKHPAATKQSVHVHAQAGKLKWHGSAFESCNSHD